MDDIFLTRLVIENIGPLHHVDIGLSPHERKHLILTGKNGSGKTSVLTALRDALRAETRQPRAPQIMIEWNVPDRWEAARRANQCIVVCHDARLRLPPERFAALVPKLPLLNQMLQHLFRDHAIHLYADLLQNGLTFAVNRRAPVPLAAVSDGYAAILSLLGELVLSIASAARNHDEVQGLVLIDGIETFLDADLQKGLLPFLIDEFPRVQFMIATHSRLVLNSFEQAVIFDLDRQHRIDDRLTYPYEAIIEQYDLSQHSDQIKQMLEEYEQLLSKKMKTEDEEYRILELGGYLAWIIHKFQKTPKPAGTSSGRVKAS